MDWIDRLIDILNGVMDGDVSFDRDATDVDRPDNWGAVELRGEAETVWADDQPIDSIWTADVYLCVTDRESGWITRVGEALRLFDAETPCTWSMPERGYLPELDRILWRWQVRIYGPLEMPEGAAPAGGGAGAGTAADTAADTGAGTEP